MEQVHVPFRSVQRQTFLTDLEIRVNVGMQVLEDEKPV